MNNLVSIITPCYNSEKFIKDTIASVQAQTFTNWEMIIVDDLSTDNSIKIIEEYVKLDSRIKIYKLNKNSGPAIARNKAIELVGGGFIAFLDSDDRWLPTKLEEQLEFMQVNNLSLSFASYRSYDEDGENEKVIISKKKVSYHNLLTNNYIGCLTAMYSVKKIGKVYFPLIHKRQDWALWLKITRGGVVACGMEEILALYTRRNFSVSSNKIGLLKYNWKIYREFEGLSRIVSAFYFFQLFIRKIIK